MKKSKSHGGHTQIYKEKKKENEVKKKVLFTKKEKGKKQNKKRCTHKYLRCQREKQ